MKLLFNFLLILTCVSMNSQTLLHTNGKAIVNVNGDTVILRTMNLGGWMLIEPYQLQAAGFASAQWEFEDKIEQLVGTAEKNIFFPTYLSANLSMLLKRWVGIEAPE